MQGGAATLVVTIVVLLVSTIMVTFANRSIIFDVRSSGNEARYKEAFSIAEAGLDYASQRFSANFRSTYSNSNAAATLTSILANSQVATATKIDGSLAGPGEAGFTVSIVPSGLSFNGVPIYTATATGMSADGTGTASIRQQFSMVNVLSGTVPDVPVIVGGAVGTGGNFNVVANPNGGNSPGVPISVWSNGSITAGSSSATCHVQFYSGGQCSNPSGNSENITRGTNPATAITSYNSTYPDLLPNDSNFPSDLFKFLFGVNREDWSVIKAQAQNYGQVGTSCADLIAAGVNAGVNYPVWWVAGDCDFNGGTIGSLSKPAIVVVDDHQLRAVGNTQVNGIVYLFDNPDTVGSPSSQLGGTMEIVGSFISDTGGSAMAGSYSVKYDPSIVGAFTENGSSYNFSRVPFSWRDF